MPQRQPTPHPEADDLRISEITCDPELQIRASGTHPPTVMKYADNLRAGATFPPIIVADTGNGRWLLVDGWHRLEAFRRNGHYTIPAVLKPMSAKEAAWEAAAANLKHGRPISGRKEYRAVFQAYVGAGKHRGPSRFKTYREIAQELGGTRGHTTIRNWMERDFPSVFRAMQRNSEEDNVPGTSAATESAPVGADEPSEVLRGLVAQADRVPLKDLSPEDRWEILEALERLRAKVEASGASEPSHF